MALIWADGFDHYGTVLANALSAGYSYFGAVTIYNINPRTGGYSIRATATNNMGIRRIFDTPAETVIFGCGFRVNSIYSTNAIGFKLETASTTASTAFRVCVGTDLSLEVYTGDSGGTLLGKTNPNAMVITNWQYLEVKAYRHASAGTITLRLDGQVVLSITGIAFGAVNFSSWAFGILRSFTGSGDYQFDDLYICDGTGTINNDFLGDRRCVTQVVNADTALANWTPSTGTSGAAVIGKIAPNDATYITANAVGNISEFQKEAIGIATNDIAGAIFLARALKTDAGTSTFKIGTHSGSFVANSPDQAPGTSAAYYRYISERDPNGTIPWTKTNLDAALIRFERSS